MRIIKNHENLRNQCENHEKHEIQINPHVNFKNHEIHENLCGSNEIHEHQRNQYDNNQNHKKDRKHIRES